MKKLILIATLAIAGLTRADVTIIDVDPATRGSPVGTMADVDANFDVLKTFTEGLEDAMASRLEAADLDTQAKVKSLRTDLSDLGATATGTNHATGYDISDEETRFTMVTSSDYAAALPEFSTLPVGTVFRIYNDDAADALSVFPESADALDDGTAGAGVVLEPGEWMVVVVQSGSLGATIISRETVQIYTVTGNTTLSRKAMFGGLVYVTSTAEIELLPREPGMRFSVRVVGDIAVSIDPHADDLIVLDGATSADDGDKITSASTAGDIAVFSDYGATGWYAATNGWTEEGP
jgi:hypothetical protein